MAAGIHEPCFNLVTRKLVDPVLHRWHLSKTVKGDADDDIAKYDGIYTASIFIVLYQSSVKHY